MAIYLGYYGVHPDYAHERGEVARKAGHFVPDEAFNARVAALRDQLPPSIRLVGSYVPIASMTPDWDPRRPGIWIADCDNPRDLGFINNYYAGFLKFDWVPANSLGTSSAQTAETMRTNQTRGIEEPSRIGGVGPS
ncbi:MAG: hypothetical protein AB7I38_02455 [Dehalococcoidia bacterium]